MYVFSFMDACTYFYFSIGVVTMRDDTEEQHCPTWYIPLWWVGEGSVHNMQVPPCLISRPHSMFGIISINIFWKFQLKLLVFI